MKKTIFLVIMLLLVTANVAPAQDNSKFEQMQEAKRQKEVVLQWAADMSSTARELKTKVDAQEVGVILEAAKTGDQSLKPYLKILAANEQRRTNMNSVEFEAHTALAKLGDEEALLQILTELDSKQHPVVRIGAIRKLSFVGSKSAYRKLYELLDDTAPLRDNTSHSDVSYVSIAENVMRELARAVDAPPQMSSNRTTANVAEWKAWFAKNKHLIE